MAEAAKKCPQRLLQPHDGEGKHEPGSASDPNGDHDDHDHQHVDIEPTSDDGEMDDDPEITFNFRARLETQSQARTSDKSTKSKSTSSHGSEKSTHSKQNVKSQSEKSDARSSQASSKKSHSKLNILKNKLDLQHLEDLRELEKSALEAEQMALTARFRATEVENLRKKVDIQTMIRKSEIELQFQDEQYLGSDDDECCEDLGIPRYKSPLRDTGKINFKSPDFDSYSCKQESTESGVPQTECVELKPDIKLEKVSSINPSSEAAAKQPSLATPSTDLGMTSSFVNLMTKAMDRVSVLPDIGVKFSGSGKDKQNFVTFLLKFNTAYGNRQGLSNEEKLLKLSESTAGDAKAIVDNCLLLGANGYKRAVERLRERYGRPDEVVHSIMRSLSTGPTLLTNDNFALVKLSDEVSSTIDILDKLSEDANFEIDYRVKAEGLDNMTKLLRRIPQSWRNDLISRNDVMNLEAVDRFLRRKTRNLTSAIAIASSSKMGPQTGPGANPGARRPVVNDNPRQVNSIKDDNNNAPKCDFCEIGSHSLSDCKAFTKIRPQERQSILRTGKLCFNCFGRHIASECQEASKCNLNCKWTSKHNALLHNLKPGSQAFATDVADSELDSRSDDVQSGSPLADQGDASRENLEPVSEPEPDEQVWSTSHDGRTQQQRKPFFPIIPLLIVSPVTGKSVTTFGCLDTMSSVNCADEKLLHALGLSDLPVTKTVISTVTGTSEIETKFSSLKIKGVYGDSTHILKVVEFIPGNHLRKTPLPRPSDLQQYPHLEFMTEHLQPQALDQVSLLISAGETQLHLARDVVLPEDPEMPVAVKTDLGWCVFGGNESSGERQVSINYTERPSQDLLKGISTDLAQLWQVEANDVLGTPGSLSIEDRRALEMMYDSLRKTESGQSELSLLWKEEPTFPDNRAHAEKLLRRKKTKFLRDPQYFRKYCEEVHKYLDNGFARKVPAEEPRPESGHVWYVPHHAVQHARKLALRLVFNCSDSFEGVSLNGKLYTGPDMINLLVGVLLRFRTGGQFAVSADIKSMYHCVRVPEDQACYLRWLWFENDDPHGKLVEYEMLVHLFGCLSSSACANFALRQCGLEEDPKIRNQIERSFYVDDYLASFESMEEAREVATRVHAALAAGGFTLTKFCSNDSKVLEDVPEEHRIESASITDKVIRAQEHPRYPNESFPEQVALGIRWDPNRDCILFKCVSMDLVCSKRGVLSAIARIVYDPCGLIVPVIVLPARILFQELCRRDAKWDDPLSDEEERYFRHWYAQVVQIGEVEIRRCTHPSGQVVSRELHFLSDASEKCYGSCCYLREVMDDDEVSCSLIFAKSRLAPLRKTLTLVRLELQAAHTSILCRNLLLPQLDFEVDGIHFWVDSTAILGFVGNDMKRYQVFVSNRVAQIREVSEVSDWHWIPSSLNTSDLLSRGLLDSEKFDSDHLWFAGPEFLREREIQYPESPVGGYQVPDDDPELRNKQSVLATDIPAPPTFTQQFLVKFPTWYRLKLAVSTILKFWQFKTARDAFEPKLSIPDLQDAERVILKIVQNECFQREIDHVRQPSSGPLPKSSPLRKLCPIEGDDGLLRVGGRLTAAKGSYNFRHPILLPAKHHVTEMLIREFHVLLGHGSVKQILNEMRMKFYVVGGRSAVHGVWVKCHECRRQLAQPGNQFMSALPATRLTPLEPAFSYCAVDLFGHFFVKVGRSNVKRWGAIFICESSKSVHIEIVHSMDMSSFVNALRRMCGRRGTPKQIRSDQGSNLTAADKELRDTLKEWNESGIEDRLKQEGMKWVFTSPTASHMNGLAERVIRSARRVLVHLIGQQTLTEESIQTLFVECESILNNRPIAEMSSDPSDGRVLTPNHLLQPRSEENSLPPGLFDADDNYTRKRWRQVQYLTDLFWARFRKEVCQLLQKRQKWLSTRRNLRINDLVLIVDSNSHRNDWRCGRITRVNESRDGLIRSCEVKTKGGLRLERPVTKLCLLEAFSES